jgi:hypothetical protein
VIDTAAALIVYIGIMLLCVYGLAVLVVTYSPQVATMTAAALLSYLMWLTVGLAAWLLAAAVLLLAALVGVG